LSSLRDVQSVSLRCSETLAVLGFAGRGLYGGVLRGDRGCAERGALKPLQQRGSQAL